MAMHVLTLDGESQRAWLGTRILNLTQKQFSVLSFIASNAGVTVSKEEILNEVWSGRCVTDLSVKDYISSLRRELGDPASQPQLLKTIRARGYRYIGEVRYHSFCTPEKRPNTIPEISISNTDQHSEYARTITLFILNALSKQGIAEIIYTEVDTGLKLEVRKAEMQDESVVLITLVSGNRKEHLWSTTRSTAKLRSRHDLDELCASVCTGVRSSIKKDQNYLKRTESFLEERELYFLAAEQYPKSIEVLRTLSLHHGMAACRQLGESYEDESNQSLEAACRAFEIDRYDAHSMWVYAQAQALTGEYHLASELYDQSLRLNAFDTRMLSSYGFFLCQAGKPNEGLNILKRAINADPACPRHYYWLLACAHFQLGNYQCAKIF